MNKTIKNVLGVVSIIYGVLAIAGTVYSMSWMKKLNKGKEETEEQQENAE